MKAGERAVDWTGPTAECHNYSTWCLGEMLRNFSHDFHRDLTQNPNHTVPLPKHNIQSIKIVPLCYIHTKSRV